MTYEQTEKAWDRLEADIQGLAGDLKRHFRTTNDEKNTAELNQALEQLRQAAESVFKSLETAPRDPEVRAKPKETPRSSGMASAETFPALSDEIDKAVPRPDETKEEGSAARRLP